MKLIYLYILITLPLVVFSQSLISGKVVDLDSNPIPYCNVLLVDSNNDQNYGGGTTNEKGYFEISTSITGRIKIKITSIGFEEFTSETIIISQDGAVIRLKEVQLKDEAYALNDVSVTAQKKIYERKIDRTVINLGSDLANSGSNVLDVLEKTPGVIVDRQNNSISMLGKDGVNVMINGKMTYMPATALVQYLAGMNADNAKSIELITTPPAKYDAEGNSGYINIELKQSIDQGFSGGFSVANSYSYNDSKSFQNIGGNFAANSEKHNLSFNYSFSDDNLPRDLRILRTYVNVEPFIETESEFIMGMNIPSHNLRFTYDHNILKNLKIGTTISGFHSRETQNSTTAYSEGDYLYYDFEREELKAWESAQINFFTEFSFNDNFKLSSSYDLLKYYNSMTYNAYDFFSNDSFELPNRLWTEKDSPFDINVFKVDFEGKLLKNSIDLEAGAKYVSSDFENTALMSYNDIPLDEFSNTTILDESVLAFYSEINFDLIKNLKIKGGLRYELTDTFIDILDSNDDIDREYGDFFPSMFVGYKINDFNSINLSFSKRITRPPFTSMAPILVFLDLNSAFFGNVSLRPSYSQNYQIDYSYKSINFSGQYSKETDVFAKWTPTIDEDSQFITITPNNMDFRESFNAIINFPINISNFWKVSYFSTLTYSILQGRLNDILVRNDLFSVRFNINNSINLPNGYKFQFSGFYQTKQNMNEGGILRPMGKLDVSLQKNINDNISITVNGSNILNTMVFRPYWDTPEVGINSEAIANFVKPQAKLTLVYNFGNRNIKAKEIEATEESSRIQTRTGS